MRLAVIRQHYGRRHYLRNLFDELDKLTNVTTFGDHIEGNGPRSLSGFVGLPNLSIDVDEFDSVLWFPTFQRMSVLPDFDWGGFRGRRVLLDFDACQNYSTISSNNRINTYAANLRRHQVDIIVVSGREIRDRLRNEGFDAVWMPSATDPAYFKKNKATIPRAIHFGTRYPARRVVLRELRHSGLKVEHLSCPRAKLPDLLCEVAIGVVCDMQAKAIVPCPTPLFRKLPSPLYRTEPGIEPMMKQYEYASAGVTIVCDKQPDRSFLGFVDRETCFVYEGARDSPAALRAAMASFEDGNEIADAARSMTVAWHTWAKRAPALLSACGPSGLQYMDADYKPR